MKALEISFLIAELMGYFQSDTELRKEREPRLMNWLVRAAAQLGGSSKSAFPSAAETIKNRDRVLSFIPDSMVITGAMKLFAYLTACEDDKGKRPYQLIVEKGECPQPEGYSAARKFFIGKKVTATGEDGKSIDLCLGVELVAVSNNAFPEREVTIEISPEASKPFADISNPMEKE